MKKLQGHVVRLVRSILLRPPGLAAFPSAQFFPGKKDPFKFTGGIGISWWYSGDTRKAFDAVASLLLQSTSQFRDCDIESATQSIADTLQEICVDKRLFDPDAVVFGGGESLFDCRRPIPVDQFATEILAAITAKLRARLGDRCTVYPASRLSGPSLHIWSERVHAIAASDEAAWDRLTQCGYKFNGWRPSQPRFSSGAKSEFCSLKYSYVFVAEAKGTERGARFSATLSLRKLIAVICAVLSGSRTYPMPKAAAAPFGTCIQFPHRDCEQAHIVESECGALLPYYAVDLPVSGEQLATVEQWYTSVHGLDRQTADRIDKCAHFVNRAMNSDDIEAFIGYFVALDALLGERGSVEASILNGVAALSLPDTLREKSSWLFDLRNELVHGGSRYVGEWSRYQRYYRHFDSKPEEDVRALAMSALIAAPAVMPF